jgi:hypothetical protein
MSGVGEFLSRLFTRLEESSIRYCLLRNWEALPDTVDNDVDLWVEGNQGRAFEEILESVSEELGWRLVQRWHWLGSHGDGLFVLVKPETRDSLIVDVFKYLTWKGLKYVDEAAFVRHAQRHPKGFTILDPGVEAAAIVLKEILFQLEVRERYRERAWRKARADGAGFLSAASPMLGSEMAREILDLTVSEDWSRLAGMRGRICRELARRSWMRDPIGTARLCARHFYFRARHRLQPPGGFFLVLIGPDGVGKTTTARALLATPLARRLFQSSSYLYRRFPLLPELKSFLPPPLKRRLTTESEAEADASENGIPPTSGLRSAMYVAYYGLEYCLGRAWLWMNCRQANGIVVLDRYWYEFVLQKRYERCPRWMIRLLEKMAAQPDALVFLDVAPEVAYGRKQEKPLAEIRRIHALCEGLVARSENGFTLPAVALEQSVGGLEQIVLERLIQRAPSHVGPRTR